ncbi:MAG: GNAT family N-acetyltransferase [Cyanobacteria bacterium SZAS LIN-5]|nr:GNAT family N-acetyltransferase [Cyanobacteria bacterium SZAS LIN-5]
MQVSKFQVTTAGALDFEQVVTLQKANSLAVLPEDARGDGFLSSDFTAEQFEQMAKSVALIVALDAGQVIGFVCASTPEFNRNVPVPAAMMQRFPRIKIGSRRLNEVSSFISGPVCVEKSYRGQGVFEALYNKLFDATATDFDVALAFIATSNPRSVKAHGKVGMDVIDRFDVAGREFYIVARVLR